jgi:hypothetical protein
MSWPMVTASAVFQRGDEEVEGRIAVGVDADLDGRPLVGDADMPLLGGFDLDRAATAGAGDEGSSACKSRARMDLTRGSAAIFRP